MKYVYYKSVPDGKIINFHKVTFDDEELRQRLKDFNRKKKQTCNAVVIDVEEGSLIDFLIHKANERVQINKGILADLDSALSEASAIVDNLRYGAQ